MLVEKFQHLDDPTGDLRLVGITTAHQRPPCFAARSRKPGKLSRKDERVSFVWA
jgi:hypothetical protein